MTFKSGNTGLQASKCFTTILKQELNWLILQVVFFPGRQGFIGFYDVGRVWVQHENSREWHNSVGRGLYFAPAQMTVLRVVAGYSREGWYPYVALGFRF